MKYNKRIISILFILTCALFMFFSSTLTAMATSGDGSGDGTGHGQGLNRNIPLTLESASIKDGETDVAVNETIQLNFNKNICNIIVLSNNKMCFHLTDPSGAAIPIKLVFPDDQVQQDYKRQAFITPVDNLASNTEYRISVDSTLTAKNGTCIDQAHTITFTTGTKHSDEENPILKELGDYVISYETAYSETADSVPVKQDGLDDVSQDTGIDTAFLSKVLGIVFIQLILVFTIIVVLIKRKNK